MKQYPSTLTRKIGFETIRKAAVEAAHSEMGRERLRELSPSVQIGKIRKQLRQAAEMMDSLQYETGFPLLYLPDIRPHIKNSEAVGSMIEPEAFIEIAKSLSAARKVKSWVSKRSSKFPELTSIAVNLIAVKKLEEHIAEVIDEKRNIRDSASSELKKIRIKLERKRESLRQTINRVLKNAVKSGMASDEGPTLRNGRMVIPLQAEYKRKIKGFVHDVSSSGQTVYLEPVEALEINNAIRQLEGQEKQEIERILRLLTDAVRVNHKTIRQNVLTLTLFDVIAAKAEVSVKLRGNVPAISVDGKLRLENTCNPILLLKVSNFDKENRNPVVPLNLDLDSEEACLVITGPNAGGKSVAIKTVGLCVMMAQSGFAIPAKDSSELPVYESLFVDMGDEQSIENDLSTFSSRLRWMKDVVENATEKSLILIDEAAAGTDPEEGGALFQALIEVLITKGAKILVTTHQGSLKVFAHNHPKAVNGSMEFDQASLSPTYQFKKGVPGSSYAFEIAKRMNLDDDFLASARLYLGEKKNSMEQLISELEEKTQHVEELKKKYKTLQSKMEAEKNRYEEKRSGIEKEKESIREKALIEAREIMASANRKIEEAVEKVAIQEKKDSDAIKDVRKEVAAYKKGIDNRLNKVHHKKEKRRKKSSNGAAPKVGDLVRLEDSNTAGELKEINGSRAAILVNGLTLKTNYDNLIKVNDVMERFAARPQIQVNVKRPRVKPSIEIRGMRGEEAMKKVEQYLDNAIASGRNEVDIIHGKGEGILKKLVHKYLDKRPEVIGYDMAPEPRGGMGCTIVRL